MYLETVKEQVQVHFKDSVKLLELFSTGSTFNVSRSSVFRKIFFKLLKNKPGYKYQNIWSQCSTIKMTPGSILNPDQYSSLHRPCVICEKLTGFLGLFSEHGRCKIPLKLVRNFSHVWMSSFIGLEALTW